MGNSTQAETFRHALALGTEPKYPPGFAHFDYADPQALKGGVLTLSSLGTFDKLNPFSLKGISPLLLGGLVFESLTESSLDEPFAVYGLLAESMAVADDQLSITYRLNPRARFADGTPVTAADVVFSFQILRSEAASPFYRYYYRDIQEVEALDQHTVRLRFARRNPELPLIAGQVPILPKHFFAGKDFERDFISSVLGSGPYVVKDFAFGKYIRYRRNPEYWGRDLNVNVGKYNFDEIVVKYYRDDTVRLEGLKAGEFDFLWVNNSKQWALDVAGDKWEKGYLVKETLRHHNTAGMQGFVFNLRRPIFQNRDVRHALSLAFDFEWSNRTLFYGQYTRNDSFFDNSELAAEGLPSPEELKLLEPLRPYLPPAVFTEPMGKPEQYRSIRQRLRAAKRLLRKAGWKIQNGVLTETKTGRQMRFTITLVSPAWQRIVEPYIANLRKLGVQATMKLVDESIYERIIRTRDFDMVVEVFPQSQSPGNEQRDYWHSDAADIEGSRNIIGIKNLAVDALVEAIITAPTRRELLTATHALDRVLWHEHYVVPHWYIDRHRITYWNKFSYPQTLPLYYTPLSHLMFWWVDPEKERALAAAMAQNRPLRLNR
ncbi:MAG: ABC transporter substrate-binding protein [Nitrospinota bacterium]|nr:MAG: ABC transporter substrate-binding protein [Nitrospinota bacterium]